MGKTLILKSLLRSPNSISFMLIIFTFKLIQTIRILWFCHRSRGVMAALTQANSRLSKQLEDTSTEFRELKALLKKERSET
jgi:hypothetical protein